MPRACGAATERGISKMMLALYRNYADPLTDKTMLAWHQMMLAKDRDIKVIGRYRTPPIACRWFPVPFTSARSISWPRHLRACRRK